MTQSGSPYDNAIAERVNGILKTELNLGKVFTSYRAAVPVVGEAIYAYNHLRPHMSCENLTPAHAHNETKIFIKKWKTKKYCKAKSVLFVNNCKAISVRFSHNYPGSFSIAEV